VQPHLALAFGAATGGHYSALSWPKPRPLSFAAQLGPVRAGMRAAVTSGTATALASLPVPVGAKTGTAEDATAPNGATDSWLSAVAPLDRPVVTATAFVHGGAGHGLATAPIRSALEYFLAHEKAILASAPMN
jgi:cell division protein FtsI/penicillin-binding protein 2